MRRISSRPCGSRWTAFRSIRREGANEADRQRCADVALARADIQVRYDPLEQQPFLNAIAIPQHGVVGKPVRFTTYSNYSRYIARAEMRLFAADQSVQQKPIAVIPVRRRRIGRVGSAPFHDPLLQFISGARDAALRDLCAARL